MYLLRRRIRWRMYIHWLAVLLASLWSLQTVDTLTGAHVCSEKQKYNVTKRIKYRAPMAVRTYEWCLAVPPRCSRWTTEMRDLTKLETEERTMEVSVCCPGFTLKSASCHAKCPSGKTGNNCTEQCPKRTWGPSCSMDCVECPEHSSCSPYTGNCVCSDGWKGERCEKRIEEPTTVGIVSNTMPTTSTIATTMIALTTSQSTLLPTVPITESTKSSISSTRSFSNPLTTETSTITMTIQKPITTTIAANIETTRKQSPISQNTDITTKNVYFNNDTKNHKHELEMSITEPPTQKTIMWTITETPINITTTTTKLTSEHRQPSTIKTTLKDVPRTTQSQSILTTKPSTTTAESATKLMKSFSTVPNVKPKEIWIKPTQKGDSVLIDPKHENSAVTDFHKHKYSTKTHPIMDSTTLRTIIVSIIPTSVDHTAVFKKITIASSEHRPSKKVSNNTTKPSIWKIIPSTNPSIIKMANRVTSLPNTVNPLLIRNISKYLNEIATSMKPKIGTLPSSTISPFATYLYTNSLNFNFTKSVSNDMYVKSTKSHNDNITNTKSISINTTNSKPATEISNTYSKPTAGVPSSTPRSILEATRVNPPSKKNISSKYVTKIIKFNPSIATRIYLLTTPSPSKPLSKNVTSTPVKSNSTISVPVNKLLSTFLTTRQAGNSTLTSTGLTLTTTKFTEASIVKNSMIIKHNETATHKSTPVEDPTISKLAVKAADTIGKKETNDDAEAKPKLTNTNHNLATNQALTNTITPTGDEVFNVLTEPEHITAVAEGTERNTDNLLSVLSIVVSVMFIVIAVAVVIVMMERSRRSRYEDVVKFDNLRMGASGGDEHLPPYVRSIFHTPLPEPPVTEKSHYQPISTLDRNLKQFMRPVAVHSISPVMMENFRGILECHYDHLPARNSHISFRSDTLSSQFRCSITPSTESPSQRCSQRSPSSVKKLPVTDLSVEKLKHEGKVEVIDSTTTEPLYAEIPCWRLVPQHAIEVVNLNGEAVTEL